MVRALDSGSRFPGSSPGRVIVLCSSLHPGVYIDTVELSGKPDEILGVTCDGLASHPGGVAILLVASRYGNLDKHQPCGPVGSCADFTFTLLPLDKYMYIRYSV